MAAGRGRICMGIFLLALSLTACSRGQGEASREKFWIPEYVAAISQVDLPDRVARDVYLCNGELVFSTYQMDGGSFYRQEYYTLSVSQPGAALEKFSLQSKGWSSVYDMVRDEQGNYYILEGDADYIVTDSEDRRMSGFCVCVYDAEGGLREKYGISQWLLEEGGQMLAHGLAVDGQGNIYVLGPEFLLLIDSAGQYRGCIRERIFDMICGADGQIYYINYSAIDRPLKKIDFAQGKGETVCSNFPVGHLFRGENGELWVYDRIGVYCVREAGTDPELVFSWLDVDIDSAAVREMALLPDGQLLAVMLDTAHNWGIQTVEEAQPLQWARIARAEGEDAGRKLLTVAVMSISEDMRLATLQYNREHPDYRVVLKDYAGVNGQRSHEEAVAAMDLDLVSGREPDILAVDYLDLERYTSKGLLEDLNQYLDSSDKLHREDLVETVVNAYTLDGKLVALPTWFRLETIIGKKSMLGEGDHWNIGDMAAFFDKYQDARVWQSASPESMLEICMKFNQPYFVDWGNGSCDFDSEEFIQLLEFAGQFSGKESFGGWNRIRQEDGRALLWIKWCAKVDFVSEMPQWFEGEEVSYIGYPVLDGKPGIMLETSADSYGILSVSPHREQAWDYLEYVILAKGGSDEHFSVLRKELDRMLEESAEGPYELDEDGEVRLDGEGNPVRKITGINTYIGNDLDDLVVYDYVPLPEEAELVKELVSRARPAPGFHEVIENIILEEAAGYFAGDRGAEETAVLIQNRVQLYLDEQK